MGSSPYVSIIFFQSSVKTICVLHADQAGNSLWHRTHLYLYVKTGGPGEPGGTGGPGGLVGPVRETGRLWVRIYACLFPVLLIFAVFLTLEEKKNLVVFCLLIVVALLVLTFSGKKGTNFLQSFILLRCSAGLPTGLQLLSRFSSQTWLSANLKKMEL